MDHTDCRSPSTKTSTMERKALSPIEEHERQSWFSIAFIWIGTMICIPMLMVGGILTTGLTLYQIVIASALGFAICTLIMTLTGIQGTDLGLPAVMCATKAFGNSGSRVLMSVMIALAQIGWFGVQTATCATAFNTLFGYVGIDFPFWASCLIWGAVMMVTAVYGFKMMKFLNYVAVPTLLIMCLYGVFFTTKNYGIPKLLSFTPDSTMSISSAVSMTIGLFAVGTIINSDYSRYSRNRLDTAKASILGVLPAAIFMILVGAIMAVSTGNFDITAVFAGMGLPVLGMLVLILATWTTNTSNAYTAGLAVMKIFNFKDEYRSVVTLLCGIVGTLLAMLGIMELLSSYISVLASMIPPIAGIMIADYWIIGRGRKENWYPIGGFNWIGIFSWIAGSTVALFFSFYSPALDGIVVCCLCYVILYFAFGKTALLGNGPISVNEASQSL